MSGVVPSECERVYQALVECHRRIPGGATTTRDVACRHLNRSLGECMIGFICPEESSAVKSLCGNNKGTSLKRSQCQQAQISLAAYQSSMRGELFLFYRYSCVSGGPLLVALVAGEAAIEFEEKSPVESVQRVTHRPRKRTWFRKLILAKCF